MQCPRSKVSKFRFLYFYEIVEIDQKEDLVKKMAMLEQLNDQLLVDSK